MPKIAIITDTACDLTLEEFAAYDVKYVPLTVAFGARVYADGVDLTRDEFYHILTTSQEPGRTAQVAPEAFAEVFRQALPESDQVLVICLSSGLSGTYESACLAQQQASEPERIKVFDSRAASIGQALMVIGAVERARAGKDLETILNFLADSRARLSSVFTLDTLEYLVRGGRLSRVQGLVGTLLNIKPVLQLDEAGRIVPREKVRGRRQAIERLLEIMAEEGRHLEEQRVGICHSRCAEEAADLAKRIKNRFKVREVLIGEISATIGSHVGPGCLSVFFLR